MSTDPSDLGPLTSREDVERVLASLAGRIEGLESELEREREAREDLREAMVERNKKRVDADTEHRRLIIDLQNELDEQADRIQELEAMHAALRDVASEKTTKEQKIATVVGYAENKHELEEKPAVTVLPKRIAELTGCSRRYAYDLVDDMTRSYEWAVDPREEPQYGSLEKDRPQKGVLVDFELLHADAEAVNKFTTGGRE